MLIRPRGSSYPVYRLAGVLKSPLRVEICVVRDAGGPYKIVGLSVAHVRISAEGMDSIRNPASADMQHVRTRPNRPDVNRTYFGRCGRHPARRNPWLKPYQDHAVPKCS